MEVQEHEREKEREKKMKKNKKITRVYERRGGGNRDRGRSIGIKALVQKNKQTKNKQKKPQTKQNKSK